MNIRDEIPEDADAITNVTRAAFEHHPFSRQTEQFIIVALRKAGALTISLVAELDGRVVGHVAFSPLTLGDESVGWYGVGPLSVHPEHQRRGIGQALMKEGLTKLKSLNSVGCVLVGDPKYYERLGFRNFPGLSHEGVPPEYVLALPFTAAKPQGVAIFHPAFTATE